MLRLKTANDVDVFEAGLTVEPQVRQVLPEEAEAFAKKKNRDQREDDDRDERIPAEENLDGLLDRVLGSTQFCADGNEDAGVGDAFHARPSFADASAPRQRL